MTDEQKAPPLERQIAWSNAHRVIFTNVFQMRFGDNDVAIDFATIQDAAPGGPIMLMECQIMMTPRSAKILHYSLGEAIKHFESANGHISVREGQLDEISSGMAEQFVDVAPVKKKAKTPKPRKR